jgi:cellulose synthase/poly-beta-1,6-N-acetylglucosamine synthase-like glycosyltransferase
MTDIEIPLAKDRSKRYRFFEILPGFLSWSILIAPFVMSIVSPRITALIIICFFLIWFVRAIGLNIRVLQGWSNMQKHKKYDWVKMLEEIEDLDPRGRSQALPKWHYENIDRLKRSPTPIKPSEVVHAVFVAAYNESKEIIEPTIQSVLDSNYDMKKVILVFAYEGRDGAQSEKAILELADKYGHKFKHIITSKHPLTPGEVRGKGPNITYAARELRKYLAQEEIDPSKVMVTTLDADNRPHKNYLANLSYLFSVSSDPIHTSYQPLPIYTNNIWDAPAPMRVIATGNSLWNLVLSLRPHMLRNFSAHAQPMDALIATNYWSCRTVVEDGHQFWRTYFRFEGNHEVYPIYLPIYQDAVLADTFKKTIKAQFIQIRRWAYGASDIAYVAEKGFFSPNKISKTDRLFKFLRLLEGHVSWATAPLILAFAALIPALFNSNDFTSNQLPLIASRIQTVALGGIFITFFMSIRLLPPKPARYKHSRSVFMILQWALLPFTTILFNALAALTSQTRLMFGRYFDVFDVTDKSVKK